MTANLTHRLKFKLLFISTGLFAALSSCSTQEQTNVSKSLTSQDNSDTEILADNSTTQMPPNNLASNQEQKENQEKQLRITNANQGWNDALMVDDVPYDLYIPPNYGNDPDRILPCVLVLPGWDYSRTSWVENTELEKFANERGYALILPEMLQTLYASNYYPETELKWNQVPGGKFIKERFIKEIQTRHNLLRSGQHNTMLGLSTGGRGVALIALENPGLFVAGASLSGDFSQENTPQDRLMTAVYGPIAYFPDRWTGRDNPQSRADEWNMPLYLAHGTADDIVPESQSRLFYEALKQHHDNNIRIEYNAVQGAGHDYQFWGGQLKEVFDFFDDTNPESNQETGFLRENSVSAPKST